MKIEVTIPDTLLKEIKKTAPVALGGAAVGAGTYATIGGLGLAGLGGAVGITLLPMICIGVTVSAVGHGLYRWGQRTGN